MPRPVRSSVVWSVWARLAVGRRHRLLPTPGVEAVILALLLVSLTFINPTSAPAAPPANFTDTQVIATLGSPTDVAFLPSGRILVTSQEGKLYTSSGSGKSVAYTVPSICSDFERGLLGVAVDPSFNTNNYIYLYYTYPAFNSCSANSSSSPVNRVSRFTYNTSTNTVNGGSEFVVVDNMPSPNGNHNAGDVGFGKDGYLYISVGDGGCDLDNSNLCASQNNNARQENILSGKILRVTRDGGIPAGNPFTGSNTGVCGDDGFTSTARCRETWAWGFRNPFRFAFDPNASGVRLYANDVGQGTWEEIDNVVPGADYGWNVREGHCANGSTTNCGSPPSGMTNPVYDYQHGSCNSITAGAFVPNGLWPSTYDGSYLFADYTCGRIWRLNGSTRTDFATGPGVIAMEFGPSGSTQALYYTTYDSGGQLRKIQFTGQSNRPPVARATANKTFGEVPLSVTFDGRTSSDPDSDTLTYDWDFGDGTAHGTSANPTHSFTTEARRTVTLTVNDGRGGTDSTTLTIDAGNTEPEPTIVSPTSSATFSVGQQITLQGSATDDEDGTLPASALKWSVILHHDTHTHPFLTNQTGNNIQFNAPAPEDLFAAANSYLEIQLTATDETGLSRTISQNFQPKKVNLTFATNPTGLKVNVEGAELTGPTTVVSWAGWQIQVEAPASQTSAGETYGFTAWSDSGARAHTITTPATAQTYTATYAIANLPSINPVADARVREANSTTNYGTSTTLEVDGGADRDVETYIQFDVSGTTGRFAKAELWVWVVSGSTNGPAVYSAPNTWTESTIRWNNRPARSTIPIDDKGSIPNNSWVVYNVTPLVTGNGSYTFVLATSSADGITANSREAATNKPRLVLTPGSLDKTRPSVPANLTATAAAWNRVDLSWSHSTDDFGVAGYDVYRDGVLLTSLGYQNTFSDTTVTNTTTYEYRVRARDGAGNPSLLSNIVSVTTPNRSSTFVTEADARVQSNRATTKYGTSTLLSASNSSSADVDSYLRFTVSGVGGGVISATLRVFIPTPSSNGTADGPAVYTSGNSWSESTITWNTRPPRGTKPYDDKGKLTAGTWVTYNVTPLVAGNGVYTFVLSSTSTDSVSFSSKEGANPPQLVVVFNPSAAATIAQVDEIPQPTPTPEATAVATATPEPTSTPEPATPDATATPTLPIGDDFESGDLSGWTEIDGLVAQQGLVSDGAWAARAASNGAPASAVRSIGEQQGDIYVRTRVNIQNNDDPLTLLTLESRTGREILSLIVNRDGELAIRLGRNGDTAELRTIETGEWHDLQVHMLVNGGRSLVEVWYDGNLIYRETVRLGSTRIAAVRLGDTSTNRTFDVAFDNLAIDTNCIGTCSDNLVEPTPQPTATPGEPVDQPEPTEEPQPTVEPEPPTATPEPTVAPTETPDPTATPEPTATATPEETSQAEEPAEETPAEDETADA